MDIYQQAIIVQAIWLNSVIVGGARDRCRQDWTRWPHLWLKLAPMRFDRAKN